MGRMKKSVAIGLGMVALTGLITGGMVVYWENKLDPIMSAPSASLRLSPFDPVVVGETRTVDLGYTRVALPESVTGEPVRYDQTDFTGVGNDPSRPFIFGPPLIARDSESQEILDSISSLVMTPVRNWYEYQRIVLEQQPFSVWQVPFIGLREARARMALLTIKVTTNYLVDSVEFVEFADRGAIIFRSDDRYRIEVTDLDSGISQLIELSAGLPDIERVISALISGLEFVGDDFTPEAVDRLLAQSGIPSLNSDTPESRKREAEEQMRLEAVVEEVLARRKQNQEANQPPEATAGPN